MRITRFLILALPLAALAVVFAYGARSAEYVLNGSFERGGRPWIANWKGQFASLRAVNGGAVGGFGVRVTQTRGNRVFGLLPSGSPVPSTVAGRRYNASGVVRGPVPGRRLVLAIREWNGDRLVDSAAVSLTTTRAWQRFRTLGYRARASGNQLDIYVYEPDGHDGDRFEVDDLSLAEPISSEALDNAHVRLVWSATTGASHYAVYRNEGLLGLTTDRHFTDALLWPETVYDYRVAALDIHGDLLSSRTTAQTTTPLPLSGFQRLFRRASFWNTPVRADARVDPRSTAKIAYWLRTMRYPNLTLHAFAVPVAEAHPGDPRYAVPCTRYRCTLNAFGRFGIPVTAQPDAADDAHLAIYEPSTGREWDMWQAIRGERSWSASAGAAVSTRQGDGLAPADTAGANAANFPLLGGIIRPEEIRQRRIDHALVFTTPRTGRGKPVCPATHNGGSVTDPDALRQGQHLQLDPSLDVAALEVPEWQRTILRALQVYGMYLRDQGGTLAIYGENPVSRGYDAWALASPELQTPLGSKGLVNVPWDRFRVLAAPDGPTCP